MRSVHLGFHVDRLIPVDVIGDRRKIEREYMYFSYARDPAMRRNIGIARRLAPLLDNDRRKIELLNSLLFTLPGSPIIYYGDEIGMGDNVHLGDRNGVRTPMQWTGDRNAGFSKADPAALYLPAITDHAHRKSTCNRNPIIDMFTHTPAIPDTCQWGLFLRNHDELTLEMCTGEERDYMYFSYARDPAMRRNIGIARRLAPLLDNDRRKIELLNSLLFTLPGSPIIYYGDEIGMGDNVHLGDRNGVRTPMQWTGDRNAGFSKADPAALYLPAITDHVHGYQAINVESQMHTPHSLLHWMRQMIGIRKAHPVFGRGSVEFLRPANEKVLVYIRDYQGHTVLMVHNLAGSAQPVELDLKKFKGSRPIELFGESRFPRIDDRPYALSLGPYGYYWFKIQRAFDDEGVYGIERSAI